MTTAASRNRLTTNELRDSLPPRTMASTCDDAYTHPRYMEPWLHQWTPFRSTIGSTPVPLATLDPSQSTPLILTLQMFWGLIAHTMRASGPLRPGHAARPATPYQERGAVGGPARGESHCDESPATMHRCRTRVTA
jgi:hypothetical protein